LTPALASARKNTSPITMQMKCRRSKPRPNFIRGRAARGTAPRATKLQVSPLWRKKGRISPGIIAQSPRKRGRSTERVCQPLPASLETRGLELRLASTLAVANISGTLQTTWSYLRDEELVPNLWSYRIKLLVLHGLVKGGGNSTVCLGVTFRSHTGVNLTPRKTFFFTIAGTFLDLTKIPLNIIDCENLKSTLNNKTIGLKNGWRPNDPSVTYCNTRSYWGQSGLN